MEALKKTGSGSIQEGPGQEKRVGGESGGVAVASCWSERRPNAPAVTPG